MILNHQPIVFVIVVFLEYFHNKPAWSTSDFKSLDIPFLFVKCDSLTDSLFFFFESDEDQTSALSRLV